MPREIINSNTEILNNRVGCFMQKKTTTINKTCKTSGGTNRDALGANYLLENDIACTTEQIVVLQKAMHANT